MRTGLTRYEQETTINFNKEEDVAYIFTYEERWQNHLENRLGLKSTMDNGFGGKEYQIAKRRIPLPRVPRNLTAEQRHKLGEQLKLGRGKH